MARGSDQSSVSRLLQGGVPEGAVQCALIRQLANYVRRVPIVSCRV